MENAQSDDVELELDLEPEPDPDPPAPDVVARSRREAFARLEGELALMRRAVQHPQPNAPTLSFPTTARP